MSEAGADFTLTFRRLCDAAVGPAGDAALRPLFADAAYDAWAGQWRARLMQGEDRPEAVGAAMRKVNPAFIPRNHVVEGVLTAAVEREDFAPFEALLAVLARPFEDDPALLRYATPPRNEERVSQTFCGT